MKVIEKESYKIVEGNEKDISAFVDFLEKEEESLKADNLVLDLLEKKDLKTQDLQEVFPWSEKHRSRKKSFVVVSNSVDIDELPEELAVVPTLGEAEDLIQMEEIERDLGF